MQLQENYWKMDLKRAFGSWKWGVCILTVSLSFFLGTDDISVGVGMLDMVCYAFFGGMMWLAFVPCVFVYGDCLLADHERRFYLPAILRGEQRRYLRSKFWVCFLSAALTMCLGFVVFCMLAGLCLPFYLAEGSYYVACEGVFGELLRAGHYPIYFILVGLQYGLLAGLLAIVAMYVSMWYANRLLVFAVPVFLYYLLEHATWRLAPPFQFTYIFAAVEGNRLGNTVLSFGWSVLVTIVVLGVFYLLMKKKMRMWLENG